MFGYVCVNKQELKIKDYEEYRSYYCGLCHDLHKRYGRIGQMLLNYDMTFLAVLLTGLYEPGEERARCRCIPHPLERHGEVQNKFTEYAADMTVLLSYQKALDDWRDEKSRTKRVLAAALYRDYRRLRDKYPRQARTLELCVRQLSRAEEKKSRDLDFVSGLTGKFLGEMFVFQEDIWQESLRSLGFYLGKFIYLMDAFEDMEKDEKQGNYNLFLQMRQEHKEDFDREAESILVDMMSHCSRIFEQLPILQEAQILRNILYSGVWCKYTLIREQRKKREEKKNRAEVQDREAQKRSAE